MKAYRCCAIAWLFLLLAQPKRARDLGVPFDGTPGTWNAITDVAGVEVGHTTLIEGDSVRTGVTVVWPRGKQSDDPTFGGWFAQNGNGEMTGTTWLEESGFLEGAVFITNTHSVGVVRDASIAWQVEHKRKLAINNVGEDAFWSLPDCCRNMGRPPERHQRISREARARVSGHGWRSIWKRRRRQCRRRHRNGLFWIQGRHRDFVARGRFL